MKPLQALLALFVLAFLPLYAAGLDDLTYTTNNGEVTITDCDETATGELVIPNTIDGNPVTSIGIYAFRFCYSLTNITIPNGVTSIGDRAFRDCTSLTSITIPNGVTSIGSFTFFQCRNLTSITIGNGVTSIGDSAFGNCTSLTSITIGNGVTSIGNSVFASCSSLPSITIPDSVTSIGDFTFYNCASLTSITLPENLTSIGEEAFDECTNLGTVTFQGPAPTVGNDAFAGLPTSASAIVEVGNLSSFGAKFSNWNGLTVNTILTWTTNNGEVTITDCDETATGELIIPDTIEGNPVTSIGNDAFRDCGSLTGITIPDGVTSIGSGAFWDCSSLTSITIPDGVTSIGESTFEGCSSLTSITIPDGVTSIGIYAFFSCTSLPSLTIGNGVTSIGGFAFFNCTSLTSLTIGNGVTSIGSNAFRGCTSLTSIIFQGDAPTVGSNAFSNVANGAVAVVSIEDQASFGDLGADWNGLTVNMSVSDMITALNAQNAAVATARTAGQGDVTSDPASYGLVTQASYNAVVVERNDRFTEDQINGMTTDPTIGRNAAGNMQVDISFIHSTDLQTFTPFAVNPAWVSVVDGKIALEFPPSNENTFFYRLGVQ